MGLEPRLPGSVCATPQALYCQLIPKVNIFMKIQLPTSTSIKGHIWCPFNRDVCLSGFRYSEVLLYCTPEFFQITHTIMKLCLLSGDMFTGNPPPVSWKSGFG